MRIISLTAVLVLGFAAQLLFMPAANADPDTCRVGAVRRGLYLHGSTLPWQ